MKLSFADIEQLRDAARSLTRNNTEAENLAAMGFCVVGEGRFGTYCRITEAGREFLAKHCTPEGRPGAAQAGLLLREATAREPTIVATNARSSAAILPPAAAQDVGASSSFECRVGSENLRRKVVGKVVNSTAKVASDDHIRAPERALASGTHFSTIQQRAVRLGSVSHPTAAAGSPFIAPRTRRGS